MEGKVIAALIGLAGISFGALLSGVGYFLKARADRFQVKRSVLFHLLELRCLVICYHEAPENITKTLSDYIKNKFEKSDFETEVELPEPLVGLINDFLKKTIEVSKPKIESGFIASFENSLSELSKDDPVLAHKLRGRQSIEGFLQAQGKYISRLEELEFFTESPCIADMLSERINEVSFSGMEKLISEIDSDVLLVAKKCGLGHWWSCRQLIKIKVLKGKYINEVELDQVFDSILKQFLEVTNKPS